jgi:hypothetical protein
MKILLARLNPNPRLSVMFSSGLSHRIRSKTFAPTDFKGCADFALTLSDLYVQTISEEVYAWIVEADHPLLRKKNFCFC